MMKKTYITPQSTTISYGHATPMLRASMGGHYENDPDNPIDPGGMEVGADEFSDRERLEHDSIFSKDLFYYVNTRQDALDEESN